MTLPENCQFCPVWKKSLFKDFDSDLLLWVAEKKKSVELKKKDVLFFQGDAVKGIYCHLTGLSKVVQLDQESNIRYSRFVLPGDTSGHRSLFVEAKYKGSASVVSNTLQACFIPKQDILHLLDNHVGFAKNLVKKISTELLRSEEDAISAREKTVRARLLQLLYTLGSEYSDKIDDKQYLFKCEITKRDIANLLMVANETVIRLMSSMKSEKLISYQDNKILIADMEKLRELIQ